MTNARTEWPAGARAAEAKFEIAGYAHTCEAASCGPRRGAAASRASMRAAHNLYTIAGRMGADKNETRDSAALAVVENDYDNLATFFYFKNIFVFYLRSHKCSKKSSTIGMRKACLNAQSSSR